MKAHSTLPRPEPPVALWDAFGLRSPTQVGTDLKHVLYRVGRGFQVDLSSVGHLRPSLAWPAYARQVPSNGLAPIMNFFDRVRGGRFYSQRVTKRRATDYRGKRLSYDEHDGVDFVCPIGTPLVAAAPGIVTLARDRWLRGGLTLTLDHGGGVSTQYSHLARALVPVGTRVGRGEVIALSGAAGLDLTLFFPWVAPHLHFSVWLDGVPVDPYLRSDEERETAVWSKRNSPLPPSGPDESAPEPEVDMALARALAEKCRDGRIAKELESVMHEPLALVALLEDSLHHDRPAWPGGLSVEGLRHRGDACIALSLPLDPRHYSGCIPADRGSAWWASPGR